MNTIFHGGENLDSVCSLQNTGVCDNVPMDNREQLSAPNGRLHCKVAYRNII